jgi:hypothetical protein
MASINSGKKWIGGNRPALSELAYRRSWTSNSSVSFATRRSLTAFSRIAAGQARGLYAADTLSSFSESLGREISANDMTPAIDKLVAAWPTPTPP